MDLKTEDRLRILGIDPGLNVTGYGLIEIHQNAPHLVEGGVIRGGPASSDPLAQRLDRLYEGIEDVIKSLKPDVMSIEQLYSHYERPTTAILMGHARGIFLLAASRNNLPVSDYAATQVKRMLTGNGRASKQQMQQTVTGQLNLKVVPEPADVADALAIALCHFFFIRTPQVLR